MTPRAATLRDLLIPRRSGRSFSDGADRQDEPGLAGGDVAARCAGIPSRAVRTATAGSASLRRAGARTVVERYTDGAELRTQRAPDRPGKPLHSFDDRRNGGGIYFGWLPLCLPEFFPTRVRSTGAGVSFNFGRILTALTIFATGALITLFKGDYAQIGRVTSLIFGIGMILIWFAPHTSDRQIED